MQYEETKVKNNVKAASHKVLADAAKKLSTIELLWIIIVRHKVAILATGNIILVLNYVFPEWTQLVKSLF